jgi:hypothetical protein
VGGVDAEAVDALGLPVLEDVVHLLPRGVVGRALAGLIGEVVAVAELDGVVPVGDRGAGGADVVAGGAGRDLGGDGVVELAGRSPPVGGGQGQRLIGRIDEVKEAGARGEEVGLGLAEAEVGLALHVGAVAAGDVVGHEVEDDLHVVRVDPIDQLLELGHALVGGGGVVGADVVVVADRVVVAGLALDRVGVVGGLTRAVVGVGGLLDSRRAARCGCSPCCAARRGRRR